MEVNISLRGRRLRWKSNFEKIVLRFLGKVARLSQDINVVGSLFQMSLRQLFSRVTSNVYCFRAPICSMSRQKPWPEWLCVAKDPITLKPTAVKHSNHYTSTFSEFLCFARMISVVDCFVNGMVLLAPGVDTVGYMLRVGDCCFCVSIYSLWSASCRSYWPSTTWESTTGYTPTPCVWDLLLHLV